MPVPPLPAGHVAEALGLRGAAIVVARPGAISIGDLRPGVSVNLLLLLIVRDEEGDSSVLGFPSLGSHDFIVVLFPSIDISVRDHAFIVSEGSARVDVLVYYRAEHSGDTGGIVPLINGPSEIRVLNSVGFIQSSCRTSYTLSRARSESANMLRGYFIVLA